MQPFLHAQWSLIRQALFALPPQHAAQHTAPLDGLRGLAVLFVFMHHCYLAGFYLVPDWHFLGAGKRGVWLFFVLSAYLLSASLFEHPASPLQPAGLRRYAWRRVLRIYPLFGAVLLCSFVTTWVLHAHIGLGFPFIMPDGAALLRHLLLLEGRDVMWSVGVEFQYYLLIPPVVFLLRAAGRRHLAVAVGVFLAGCGVCMWLWPAAAMLNNDRRLGPYLVIFLLGSFTAFLNQRYAHAGIATRLPRLHALLPWFGGCAALVPVVGHHSFAGAVPFAVELHHFLQRDPAWVALCWSAAIFGLTKGRNWLTQCFAHPFLRSLGVICFGFYLLHPMMITLFAVGQRVVALPSAVNLLGAFGLTYVFAALSHVYIERPALRWK